MSKNTYFKPADILLPKSKFEKWAVVACDQYTSEPEYWKEVEDFVGDDYSAYNIILPEAYLGGDTKKRIEKINSTMSDYIEGDCFNEYKDIFVYVERTDGVGNIRKGLVGVIDLNDYDYNKGSNALIRATEQTVLERIPPRVEIRKDAPLEMPHVMLLIDDESNSVIGIAEAHKESLEKLYEFNLMQDSGSIKGYKVTNDFTEDINNALEGLMKNEGDMLFAVGDGNHSLATAKECYNLNKNEKSRYALVEVVNIHDASLEFEPIYRTVFGVNPEELLSAFIDNCGGEYDGADAQKFTCLYGETKREISVKPTSELAVGTLQSFLDEYLKEIDGAEIDYIHGEKVVETLAKRENTIGFIFEGMGKSDLFTAVMQDGSLPRKTFSMGHAADKRFYIEARKIK